MHKQLLIKTNCPYCGTEYLIREGYSVPKTCNGPECISKMRTEEMRLQHKINSMPGIPKSIKEYKKKWRNTGQRLKPRPDLTMNLKELSRHNWRKAETGIKFNETLWLKMGAK